MGANQSSVVDKVRDKRVKIRSERSSRKAAAAAAASDATGSSVSPASSSPSSSPPLSSPDSSSTVPPSSAGSGVNGAASNASASAPTKGLLQRAISGRSARRGSAGTIGSGKDAPPAAGVAAKVAAPPVADAAGASVAVPPTATAASEGTLSGKYSPPEKLGLKRLDFINVHRKDFTGRIELMQGSVEGLAPEDETDLMVVYLRERGVYKGNRDSALAALNRSGLSLAQLEKETKPQPSYRRHYHCWLSRPLPKPRPRGFEFKRLLVYEDPGEELTRDDNIVLDIMKCLTTVLGGDVQISSVLLPLSGALLSPSLRKHFVKAAVDVSVGWMQMGLPLKTVKILLPETDITKDIETFAKVKSKTAAAAAAAAAASMEIRHDVFFSYAEADRPSAQQMMAYLRSKNENIRVYDAEPREVSVRARGVVNEAAMGALNTSRIFLSLLSDDYFHSVECTEAFSLAYCRDFESQGNFIIPLFWRSCDLTPLARRLVATEGVDCREAAFESATMLLDEILSALSGLSAGPADAAEPDAFAEGTDSSSAGPGAAGTAGGGKLLLADKLLMKKENGNNRTMFREEEDEATVAAAADAAAAAAPAVQSAEDSVENMFFDKTWREEWAMGFSSIVFGPRIGAGGFGEVYKCKWENQMVAVKTLQKVEDDDPQAVMAEFMVEMKLMSKLSHPNVVSFLGASIQAPSLAIILEFMPGGSLYRAIHRRRRNNLGPFPLLKSLWIAFGVAKGMEYLHAQYPVVIHRDLKSPNILLGTNVREVKITDFGLSRLRVATYVNTGPGGTPEWMAPELLRQDPFDEQSDVFSFGVILWELVMCEKPWRDDHPMQVVFKVGSRNEKLELPPADPGCPPALQQLRQLIGVCFADVPDKRPRFSELVQTLGTLCHQER
uniref:Mitogen-activated protein kinase kinase kinase 1 n=1 Tax=Pyropia haitanensis TaxID=1262161 RepID=A0A1L5YF22_PYRHA|nr:mitogen-activated protein kinase kinase kinase 1 [Neoporphyra haitanensis]